MAPTQATSLARALGGHKAGAGWMARCPAHEDSTPSLSLRDTIGGRVLLYCHAGCTYASIVDALAHRGLWADNPPGDRQSANHAAQVAAAKTTKVEQNKRLLAALRIWTECSTANDTAVATYLRQRGITVALPSTIKFHRSLAHPSGMPYPAMVALVASPLDNRAVGVHRTFLSPDATRKADVKPNKMMLGPCRGGVVRLGPQTQPLMIGEGIETCLAAMQATRLTAWAALSTSGMSALALPRDILDVVILADGDAPGERAAATAARHWASAGRRIRIARPPLGQDFNDVLLLGD